ncbi:MAG: SDR family NAD(P)-dependent oxidoreductase, partial [Phycicoccus sp.]
LRTARRENEAVGGQVVTVPANASGDALLRIVEQDVATWGDRADVSNGDRRVRGWRPSERREPAVAWRAGGVYLVCGGAGGLGLLFAREIAHQAAGAVLCLTGRSPLGPGQQAQLAALRTAGATVEYHRIDVTDEGAMRTLIVDLRDRHGGLHGVLHAAGVLADELVVSTTDATFASVLAPKVCGCVVLDELTRDDDLDMFVLFSSIMGAAGNIGQAAYATANAFLDAFAEHRDGLVRSGARSGRTLSVGWPLWRAGGMGRDAGTRASLAARSGLAPMPTSAGLEAFGRAFGSTAAHVVVGCGDQQQIAAFLADAPPAAPDASDSGAGDCGAVDPWARDPRATADDLDFLRRSLAELLEQPVEELDDDEPVGSYGVDSILGVRWIVALEASFGPLPKTLLYEHPTVRELADHLGGRRRSAPAADRLSPRGSEPTHPQPVGSPRGSDASTALDIAVVGLSGRYPGAADLEQFWRNLRDGRDCVTEVPAERWDWREHYSADRDEPGKHHSRWGGFVDDIDRFDPLFFSISPHEADLIDPQERLFLEHAWQA